MKESEEVIEKRKRAQELIKTDGTDAFTMRSCWNCNGAHEHLKNSPYVIHCIECGRYFYEGVDVTVEDKS